MQGLKAAEDWLKKPENIKKLLKMGVTIATTVAPNEKAQVFLKKINKSIDNKN